MIRALIEIFEKLRSTTYEKFSHTRVGSLDSEETIKKVRDLLEEYNKNVLALIDLEPYINKNNFHKREPSYLNMVISFLMIYKYRPEMKMDEETESRIRNDEHIIEALIELDERLDKGVETSISYEPVQKEIKDLDAIIDSLKEISSLEYLDQPIIKMIYDYLKTETHISYKEKYIEIGTLIAKHNINVEKRRTRM